MSVKNQHADYIKLFPKWKRVRDVCAGQDEIHKAGVKYLPSLKEQSADDYKAYVTRTPFFNASWRTIAGLSGMMFRKPPVVEVPDAVEVLLEDVTLRGVPFNMFVEELGTEALKVERYGILVDHPQALAEETLTIARAQEMGLRPTMQFYQAEAIINWRYRRINNKWLLAMVVLEEDFIEDDPTSEFKQKVVKRYRVLDLNEKAGNTYRQRIFEVVDEKDVQIGPDIVPLMNNAPLSEIPFFCDFTYDEPPLIDLVDLNLSHYRTNADYEHGCHYTGLPTPWISGVNIRRDKDGLPIDKFYIGSQSAWVFEDPGSRAEYLEFSGQGLEALEKNLRAKEQQMSLLGARMLADEKKQVETLGATAIKRTGENSVLSTIAIGLSLRIEEALTVFCKWAGFDQEVEFEINREFLPAGLDSQQLAAIIAAWQSGAISEADLFELLKKGDLIDSEKTLEDHQGEIDANPPLGKLAAEAGIEALKNPDGEEDDDKEKKKTKKDKSK